MRPRFIALAALTALTLSAQVSRIHGPIDTGRTATVRGQVHPYARSEFDQGVVEAAFPLDDLSIVLAPSDRQQKDLEAFLQALQDPASPDFERWLTPEQFANRFGPSPSDYAQVVGWLEAQGFSVHGQVPSRNWISFGGTAALARQAFGVEIHRYQVNGQTHFANSNDPTVPEALSGLVAGFRGLHDFLPQPQHLAIQPNYTSASSGNHYLAPDDVATIYNVAPLYSKGYDGTGQKIVVAGQTAIALSDIENFRSIFGLTANDPQLVLVAGSRNPGTVSGDEGEADLDLEWLGAVARKATIVYVYSTNVLDSVQYAVAQNLAPVISYSYGECETYAYGIQHQLIAQQANAQGITWIAGSGDTGAASCESANATSAVNGPSVSLPASVPEVTGVGGTRFQEGSGTYWNASNSATLGSVLSYIPEIAWNDTPSGGAIEASGGGASVVFSKPSWQAGTGVPADGARDVPDVAMPASPNHDGAIFCTSGSCAKGIGGVTTVVGGTSLSAPLFAGITALVGQYRVGTGAASQVGLGNVNPSLYALAQTSSDVFHDITSGNNVVPCRTGTTGCTTGSFGFQAGVGYDQVTGLGSVNAYNLAQEYKPYTAPAAALLSVSVSPSTVTAGNSATVTVNLSSGAPTGGAVVQLSTSNSAFPVAASLTIPAGQSVASVSVKAASVTASVSATITATYLTVSKTTSVTVAPVVLPSLASVSVSPSSLTGGSAAVVSITLSSAAPAGGVAVALSSSNTAFPVPSSATVAAGQSSVSLSVTTKAVTATASVTVTATYQSVSKTANATLTVAPVAALNSVTITPTTLVGGGSAVVTVALTASAPSGGASVALISNSAAFPVPASVTVPAGQSLTSVSIVTKAVTAIANVTVTATYQSIIKTASVTLTVAPVAALNSVTITPTTLVGGGSATVTVALTASAPTGGASVALGSNSAALPVPASVTVPAGQSLASVSITTSAVTATASVTVTATYLSVSKTANATLTVAPVAAISSITVSPATLAGGASATVTVALTASAPTGGASVALNSNSSAFPVPASVSVPAGRTSASVTVQSAAVSASTTVTVTATYGSGSKTATVTVNPVTLPKVTSVSIAPASVAGGAQATFTIVLSGPAPPGGASIALATSNAAAFPLPSPVTMPAGYSSGYLTVVTGNVTASTVVTATASYNSSSKTATVTVTPATAKSH